MVRYFFTLLVVTTVVVGVGSVAVPVAHAQGEEEREREAGYLIVCDGAGPSSTDPCGMEDLWDLLNRGIRLLIYVALFISTLVFMYAGFLYLVSTDKRDKTKEAKDMMKKSIIGIIVLLIAWITVSTITRFLGLDERYNYLNRIEQQQP
jgi:hypothetical protein